MSCSGPFVQVLVHTAKCSVCDQRNRTALRKCGECGEQFCPNCYIRLGPGRLHGPPDDPSSPVRGVNGARPVMAASARASMSTHQTLPARSPTAPAPSRDSTLRRPSGFATRASSSGSVASPILLGSSPPRHSRDKAVERAPSSSSPTLAEPASTLRRNVRARTHVSTASSPTPEPDLSTLPDPELPLLPEPGLPLLYPTPHIPPPSSATFLVRGSKRCVIGKPTGPKSITAAEFKKDFAAMVPSEEEQREIEAARSRGTLKKGPSTAFSRFANRLSRQLSWFQTIEECQTQQIKKPVGLRPSLLRRSSVVPPRRPATAPAQEPSTASARAPVAQQQPHVPIIINEASDDEDEYPRPPNYSRFLGNRASPVTPVADSNVTCSPSLTWTTPILSVDLKRLDVPNPHYRNRLGIVGTKEVLRTDPKKDSTTAMEEASSQGGASPYAGPTTSLSVDGSCDTQNMPQDDKTHAKCEETDDVEAQRPAPASSIRMSRLRPRSSLPAPVYTNRLRLSAPSKPRAPRNPKLLPSEVDESDDGETGKQTREFNKLLDSITLPKDFYIREKEPEPISDRLGLLDHGGSRPVLGYDFGPKRQSELPREWQWNNELNNGRPSGKKQHNNKKVKVEEPEEDYESKNRALRPLAGVSYAESHAVKYEFLGQPAQPAPMSPALVARQKRLKKARATKAVNVPPDNGVEMADATADVPVASTRHRRRRGDDDQGPTHESKRLRPDLQNDDQKKSATSTSSSSAPKKTAYEQLAARLRSSANTMSPPSTAIFPSLQGGPNVATAATGSAPSRSHANLSTRPAAAGHGGSSSMRGAARHPDPFLNPFLRSQMPPSWAPRALVPPLPGGAGRGRAHSAGPQIGTAAEVGRTDWAYLLHSRGRDDDGQSDGRVGDEF